MATKKSKSRKKKIQKKKKVSFSFWKNKALVMPVTGVLAFTFLLFSPSLGFDFVNWDDPLNLYENPHLRAFDWQSIKGIFTSTIIGNYNPLTIFSFAIERAIFGFDPWVFHLNNLLLHLVCVFFVYRIALGMNLSPVAAAIVALLFGVHPMRVESVAWITERKDVLYGAFYLAAIYQYIRYLKSGRSNKQIYWSIILLFVLSLLSKIQAVSLPLSLLAIDYWFDRPVKWKLLLEKAPYFLLSLGIGLLGVFLLSEEGSLEEYAGYTFIDRLFIGGYSYLVYLIKFIFPYEMSPLYPYPDKLGWQFYVGTGTSLLIVAGIIYAFFKKQKALVFSFAFFTFNIFFLLQILGAGQGFIADRFTYIPYLGLFLGIGYVYQQLTGSRLAIFQTLLGLAFIGYSYLTWHQNKIWENGETLWTHSISDYPKAVTPWSNRADYYQDTREYDKAVKDYENAVMVAPEKNTLYNSWGKTLFDMGQTNLALEKYNTGINLPKPFGEIYINRGVAYASQGRYQLALSDINKGLELHPENSNGYRNRGLVYYELKQFEKTVADLTKFFSLKSGTAEEWFILGLSYKNTGDNGRAISAYTNAIKINPSDKRYYNSRASAYQAMGRNAEAARDRETAGRL